MERYDVVIIGSGPGGYVAAIKAAKLGMKTAIVEERDIGGTCLNRGCIPTKTIMHSSHLYREAKAMDELGIHLEGLSFHMEKVQHRKDEIVQKMRQSILQLLEANGVKILRGRATILKDKQVEIKKTKPETLRIEPAKIEATNIEPTDMEATAIEANNILIATGSKPVIPKLEGVHLPNVITSDELLSKTSLYQKLLIIGGGVIGIEFASIYSDLGCEVEIIEAMDRITPNMDKELSQSIAMNLKKRGVIIHTKAKVIKFSEGSRPGELICEYEEKGQLKTTTAEGILLSVGRRSNTEDLFGPDVEIELENSCIKVNENFETNIQGIYAIGDVIKGKQLAHAASAQGIIAIEKMCGKEPSVDISVIPACIYTSPEVAAVGMTEEEAVSAGYTVKSGKYLMLGNGKTLLSGGERGFIKVICEETTGKILGAQLLCDRATDMISEFASAITLGLTAKELASVIRPHPTYSEGITEAVEDIWGRAIHLMPKRKP